MKKIKPFHECDFSCLTKTFRIMRITLFLMLAVILQTFANEAYSQKTKLSLDYTNTRLEVVLDEIEDLSEFFFLANEKLVDLDRSVNISVENKKIDEILDMLFADTDVVYTITDRKIILAPSFLIEDAQQQRSISGKVTDSGGQPLPGVTVVVKGTTQGTVTNPDGEYTLSNIPEDATLVFSFVGMHTQELQIEGRTTFMVVMEEESIGLEEVVAVGYGVQTKREVTGSIGSLVMDDNITRPVGNIGQALYGKISGVQILQGSGQPGSSSSIQIRGINSISAGNAPLIVIDGIQMPEYDLNSINSSDIQSIEVLKDAASASIYGSRGANGVVLVTTKSGKKAEKSSFQLNYSHGIQQLIRKIDVMNAKEYAQASIDAAQNGWVDIGGDPNAPNTIEARGNYLYTWPTIFDTPELLPYDTDWQDVVYRTAPMHDINIRFSGGDQISTYNVSVGYLNQEGIMITSDYEKYTLNLKANSSIGNWFEYGAFINVLYDYGHEPDSYTPIGAVQYPAIYPIWGDDGYLGGPQNTPGFENWFAILFRPNSGHPYYNINRDFEFSNLKTIGNLFARISLLEGLNIRTSINTYISRRDNKNYYAGDHLLGPNYFTTIRTTSSMSRIMKHTWENLLTYDKKIGNHSLNLLGGYEYNTLNYYQLNGERRDYDNDDFPYLAAGQTIYGANDAARENKLISYFTRLHYNYLGKYFLTAQFRRDGSSRFGPEKKWGNFPSLSFSWNIAQEPFMESLEVLYNFKLRASYGFTGNDNFSDYRWISRMTQAKVAIGNSLLTSYYPSSIENPDLGWERTKQLNLGIDIGFVGNRFMIEADAYRTISDGLLLDVPVPSTSGFSSVFTNIGQVENKGLELNIVSRNLTKQLTWTTQVTYSSNKSKVLQLGPDNSPLFYNLNGGMQNTNMVGEELFSFYAYKYEGVYKSQAEIDADPASYSTAKPGDGKYKDVNGDGQITAADRTIIGKNTPDFIYGMTNSFTFKGFDFSFLLQGLVGMDVYDVNYRRSMRYHEGRNYYGLLNNRWRSEEEPGDGYIPRLTVTLDNMVQTASSFWLVDGSYLRLKDVTLGYTLPKEITNKIGVAKTRVYFNGTNLFTFTNAPVNDPENFLGSPTDMVRESHSPYPTSKIYSFGINIEL